MKVGELEVVNAFFGFCTLMGNTWPAPLVPLGYRVVGIETEITSILDQNDRTVVPDIVCASAKKHHALCVDAKSSTVDKNQERAYEALEPRMLISQGVVPPDIDPSRLSNDSLLVTAREYSQKLCFSLDKIGVCLPVVAADEMCFSLSYGQIHQSELHQVFTKGIPLRGQQWPRHFVPFNSRSSIAEMVATVIRALFQLLHRGGAFSIEDIASRAVPHWDLCGRAEQRGFRDQIAQIL